MYLSTKNEKRLNLSFSIFFRSDVEKPNFICDFPKSVPLSVLKQSNPFLQSNQFILQPNGLIQSNGKLSSNIPDYLELPALSTPTADLKTTTVATVTAASTITVTAEIESIRAIKPSEEKTSSK